MITWTCKGTCKIAMFSQPSKWVRERSENSQVWKKYVEMAHVGRRKV
jgi:hypothetical protein